MTIFGKSRLLAGICLACGYALLSGTALGADAVTLASFGGAYGDSQKKAYTEPFQAETGTHVTMTEYNGGLGEIRAQVESGDVAWDVVDVEMQDAVRGCDDGLFESLKDLKLPAASNGAPASEDFLPGTLTDCGVGSIVWSTILAVRDDKFPSGKPATVKDFFDLQKFPGKRGAMKKPQTLLEWALIADGVDKGDVYKVLATEEGVARAFAKLDTIKKDVVWWEAHAQAPQLLADGEVAMTMAANGRIFDAINNDKQPFSIVWDHQIWNLDLWAIPKGSKNAEQAKAVHCLRGKARAARGADQVHLLWPGAEIRRRHGRCRDRQPAADRRGQFQDRAAERFPVLGGSRRRAQRTVQCLAEPVSRTPAPSRLPGGCNSFCPVTQGPIECSTFAVSVRSNFASG